MKSLKFLAVILFGFVLGVSTIYIPKALATDYEEVEVKCVLKASSNGQWYILNDGNHTRLNCDHIYQGQGGLILYFKSDETSLGDRVDSLSLDDDETMVIGRYHSGGSFAFNSITIYINKANTDGQVNPASITSPSANIFVHGVLLREI